MPPIARLEQWRRAARRLLGAAGIEAPAREADLILRHVLGLRQIDLALERDRPLEPRERRRLSAILHRRARRVPIQYLLGEVDFMGLVLRVTPAALIPRPETEGLVERVLGVLDPAEDATVIDVGTGCGAIALALAAARPRLEVWATDVSSPAVRLARRNARRLGMQPRVRILAGDLTDPYEERRPPGSLRALVSNPPYVSVRDRGRLAPEIVEHEPHLALFAAAGGLHEIRRLIRRGERLLAGGGLLALEIGEELGDRVRGVLTGSAVWERVRIEQDLAGKDRYALAVRSGSTGSDPADVQAEVVMDKFVVTGETRLEGTVRVSGSKNAALPMMTAALLAPGRHRLARVPRLRDVTTLTRLLQMLGTAIEHDGATLALDTTDLASVEAPYDLVKTMRASIYVLGPLLARGGRARVSLPGGCAWGPRPVDLHLKGMKALGAEIAIREGYIEAECPRGLTGTDIHLDIASVGATGNIMMAATAARGTTRIQNAACEPEMPALAGMLNAMGARIEGAGTPVVTIAGGRALRPAEVSVIADRIEAGTYLVGAAMTRGDVTVAACEPEHLTALLAKLRETGAQVTIEEDRVRVLGASRPRAVSVTTDFYPGFPTDLQAQMMALAAVAEGASVITEQIYHDRFTHVAELERLGARIRLDGNVAVVEGAPRLSGARVMATDLRASAALILAGLAAAGETHISRVYHIDRGYERIEAKLAELGASVRREQESLIT